MPVSPGLYRAWRRSHATGTRPTGAGMRCWCRRDLGTSSSERVWRVRGWGNRIMDGAAAPFAVRGAAAPPCPGRQLSAGAPLLDCGDHPVHQEADCRDDGGKEYQQAQGSQELGAD